MTHLRFIFCWIYLFSGLAPGAVFAACEASPNHPVTLFIVGDSTAASYKPENPMTGWGQSLSDRAAAGLKIKNAAIPGRSSKSYYTRGDWKKILRLVKPGDHVFIQFGHNDASSDPARSTLPFSTYAEYLRTYIADTRSQGGLPTLLTPVSRRDFKEGKFLTSHKEYRQSAIEVAKQTSVPLLDISKSTEDLFMQLGDAGTSPLFMASVDGKDNTHLTKNGANAVADLVLASLRNTRHRLAECFTVGAINQN